MTFEEIDSQKKEKHDYINETINQGADYQTLLKRARMNEPGNYPKHGKGGFSRNEPKKEKIVNLPEED